LLVSVVGKLQRSQWTTARTFAAARSPRDETVFGKFHWHRSMWRHIASHHAVLAELFGYVAECPPLDRGLSARRDANYKLCASFSPS
jgi:hypothetical protein